MLAVNFLSASHLYAVAEGAPAEEVEAIVFADYDNEDYLKQLYSEVTSKEMGIDEEGKGIYYKTQEQMGEYLYLGPNEVFFSPDVFGRRKLS